MLYAMYTISLCIYQDTVFPVPAAPAPAVAAAAAAQPRLPQDALAEEVAALAVLARRQDHVVQELEPHGELGILHVLLQLLLLAGQEI